MTCYPCSARGVSCDSCVLTELFPNEKIPEFLDILTNYFFDDLPSLKERVRFIPVHLREIWVDSKPLPAPKIVPLETVIYGQPCFPCWVVKPDEIKCCRGCPLTNYFSEKNLGDFEIIFLSHERELYAVRAEFESYINDYGEEEVVHLIDEKLYSLWEEGARFAGRKRNILKSVEDLKGKSVCSEVKGVKAVEGGVDDLGKAMNQSGIVLHFRRDASEKMQMYMTKKTDLEFAENAAAAVTESDAQLVQKIISAAVQISPVGAVMDDKADMQYLLLLLETALEKVKAAFDRVWERLDD